MNYSKMKYIKLYENHNEIENIHLHSENDASKFIDILSDYFDIKCDWIEKIHSHKMYSRYELYVYGNSNGATIYYRTNAVHDKIISFNDDVILDDRASLFNCIMKQFEFDLEKEIDKNPEIYHKFFNFLPEDIKDKFPYLKNEIF